MDSPGTWEIGAADKAAILLVKVQPHQLLVLDAKRYHGLGQVTNQEVAWCKRPGCRAGESLRRWEQSGPTPFQWTGNTSLLG